MTLSDMLKIKRGITSFIGGGGKTSLIHRLAESLDGRVVLCATTHMYPSSEVVSLISPTDDEVAEAFKHNHVICVGEPSEDGKITLSEARIIQLVKMADYVLVEADGARQKPFKAHAASEPVIPKASTQTICVIGASVFGKPISEVVHRPELFAEIAGVSEKDIVTPRITANVIKKEALADRIFINQIETDSALAEAKECALRLGLPGTGGSLREKRYMILN